MFAAFFILAMNTVRYMVSDLNDFEWFSELLLIGFLQICSSVEWFRVIIGICAFKYNL